MFLGGGALVSGSTSTPINHIVFFFRRIPVVLENCRSSRRGWGGGGVRTSCTLPLGLPLPITRPYCIFGQMWFCFDISPCFSVQGYIWEQWHALIEPYATIMPYMVGIGNHEQDHNSGGSKDPSGASGEGWHPWWGNFGDDSGGECGVPMYYRFHMPDNGNALWW